MSDDKDEPIPLPISCGECIWGYSIQIRDHLAKPLQLRTVIECRHDYSQGTNEPFAVTPLWCPLRWEEKDK